MVFRTRTSKCSTSSSRRERSSICHPTFHEAPSTFPRQRLHQGLRLAALRSDLVRTRAAAQERPCPPRSLRPSPTSAESSPPGEPIHYVGLLAAQLAQSSIPGLRALPLDDACPFKHGEVAVAAVPPTAKAFQGLGYAACSPTSSVPHSSTLSIRRRLTYGRQGFFREPALACLQPNALSPPGLRAPAAASPSAAKACQSLS